MKILLADDHSMIRQGLVLLLKQSYPSAEITEKSNAGELKDALEQHKYDIVITDLFMPGPPVIEIIKHIRDAGNKVPIIILSMSLPERNAVRVIRAGANGYLSKDTVPDELIRAMQFVLQGRKYITPEIAALLADAYLDDVEKKPHEKLSDREFEVFQMLSQGKTVTQIAEALHVSINTISTYKSRILEKMNFQSFADIIKYAHAHSLI
ncbi:response regulator [Parasediminibacterium sp. JCM 36343]|uniref:response regulator n=1 Tax=Parasediminibacterium sp. JCM 36343 TaxID=3374279 RepID=UPI003979DB29